METGYRTDDVGKSIPRNVIRSFNCRYNGELVFSAQTELRHRRQPVPALFRHRQRRRASSRSNGSTMPAYAAAERVAVTVD